MAECAYGHEGRLGEVCPKCWLRANKELAAVKAENLAMREALFRLVDEAERVREWVHENSSLRLSHMTNAIADARAALPPPKPSEKPKCVCDHMENQHTRRSPIGVLGCASCSCLAYEIKFAPAREGDDG